MRKSKAPIIEKVSTKTVDFVTETLLGDFTDAVMDRIKQTDLWQKSKEAKQRTIYQDTKSFCEHNLRKAVKLIAADDRIVIQAILEKLDVKDELKATVKCTKTQEALLNLGMAQGHLVLIVVVDEDRYLTSKTSEQDHVEPDQKDLIGNSPKEDHHFYDDNPDVGDTHLFGGQR